MNLLVITSLLFGTLFSARIGTVTQTATATATAQVQVTVTATASVNGTAPSASFGLAAAPSAPVNGTAPAVPSGTRAPSTGKSTPSAPQSNPLAASPSSPAGATAPSSNAAGNPTQGANGAPNLCQLKFDKAMEIGMTSWWHCEGPSMSCLAQCMLDIQQNLNSPNCSSFDCFPPNIPANIQVLRDLGKKFWPDESQAAGASPQNTTTQFTPYMELLANVLIQKARFCRIDFDVLTHLTEIVAASQPCCALNNDTMATTTTNIYTSATTFTVSSQQTISK